MDDFVLTHLHNIVMIIIVILSLIASIRGLLLKKIYLIVVGIVCVVSILINVILYLFGLQINPIIENFILIIEMLVLFFIISISYKNKVLIVASLIFSIIISVIVCFIVLLFTGVVYVEKNDQKYIGVYDPITGIGESHVYYYRSYGGLLIDKDWYYMENYGVILGGTDSIFDHPPYQIRHNPKMVD